MLKTLFFFFQISLKTHFKILKFKQNQNQRSPANFGWQKKGKKSTRSTNYFVLVLSEKGKRLELVGKGLTLANHCKVHSCTLVRISLIQLSLLTNRLSFFFLTSPSRFTSLLCNSPHFVF